MTDTIYQKALAEMRRCETRLDELRAFLRLYEELGGAEQSATAIEITPAVAADTPITERSIPERPPTVRRISSSDRIAKIPAALFESTALRMFEEVGRPLARHEVLEEMAKRGMEIAGSNPVNRVSTMLYRARHVIESVPGHGYWPVGRPLPDSRSITSDAASDDGADDERATLLGERAGNGAALFN